MGEAPKPTRRMLVECMFNDAFSGKTMWCHEHGDVEIGTFMMPQVEGDIYLGVARLSCGCRSLFSCPVSAQQAEMARAAIDNQKIARRIVREEACEFAYCGA